MGFTREHGFLSDLEIRNGLKSLIPNLSEENLRKAIRYLQNKAIVTPLKLLEVFEFEDEGESFDEDWMDMMFKKLAQKGVADELVKEFEVYILFFSQ